MKNMKKKTYIESISYGDDKNKFDTEEITKSLKK